MINILREGSKIIGKGYVNYTPVSGQVVESVSDDPVPAWLTLKKSEIRWNETAGEVEEIPLDDQKLEKLRKLQGETLAMLTPINIAIATQDATNKVKAKKLLAEVYTILEDDIEAIGDYQNHVTTFHLTWNPDDYATLDEIHVGIFNGGGPGLPEIVSRLLNGA